MPVIPTPVRLSQEDHKFEASLCYLTLLSLFLPHYSLALKTKAGKKKEDSPHPSAINLVD